MDKKNHTFEENMHRLEQIIRSMERGEVAGTDSVTVSRNAASKGGTSVFLDEGTAYPFSSASPTSHTTHH